MSFSHSKMTPDISSAIVNCGLYEIYKSSAWKYIKHSEIITITKRQISLSQMNQLTSIVPGTEQGLNEINDADPSENMILIDLNDIYNAFHLIFNSNYYFFFFVFFDTTGSGSVYSETGPAVDKKNMHEHTFNHSAVQSIEDIRAHYRRQTDSTIQRAPCHPRPLVWLPDTNTLRSIELCV